MKKGTKLSLSILLPLIVGAVSGYFTASNIENWYVTLIKPSFNPPNYLFGPVWTSLYVLMGISCFLIWNSSSIHKNKLIAIYLFQLTLNFCWSFIFFKFHAIGLAAVEIVILWLSILTMMIMFYKNNKWAALINIPYLLWVSFASVLNISIYLLNN
jgi:tryptophan-rich sensory protein